MILNALGAACLLVSGYMLYKLIPREGQAPWAWAQSEWGETGLALGQFVLLIAGVALLAKGIL